MSFCLFSGVLFLILWCLVSMCVCCLGFWNVSSVCFDVVLVSLMCELSWIDMFYGLGLFICVIMSRLL